MISIPYTYTQHDWGAIRPMADGTYGTMNPDKVVIHWGGGGIAAKGVAQEMEFLRFWDSYHTYRKKWGGGLAYNYGVGNTGSIYRLRGLNQAGATSGDFDNDGIPENKEALAFLWIGGAKGVPSEAAYISMERIIRATELSLVTGHLEHKATACPGPEWMQFIAKESWGAPKIPSVTPMFKEQWNWGVRERILTRWSNPKAMLDYEHFITLLERYDRGRA